MNEDIKNLKKKHKDFVNQIERDLVKDDDDFGNARRLEDYLNGIKGKRVKGKKEIVKILQAMISDSEGEVAYQDYLDQLDSPRWYLEKTYPTFYKHFKLRFDRFFTDWAKAIDVEKFDDSFKSDLFVFYCRMIETEIESEVNYKDAITYVEKNGLLTAKPGRKSMTYETFIAVVDTLFELPDMIIASFDPESKVFKKSQKEFKERQKKRDFTPGCYLEDRNSGNLDKYIMVAKLMKVFETEFKFVQGKQDKACQIAECIPSSFSKWLNSKSKNTKEKTNYEKYLSWQKDIPESEHGQLKELIDRYLKDSLPFER